MIVKIAIFEDDYTTRTILLSFLRDLGYTDIVVAKANPDELVELTDLNTCNVFLMDVHIPNNRYAGIEFIINNKKIQNIKEGSKIVFISDFENDSTEIQSMLHEVGEHYWLRKPLVFSELIDILTSRR